MECEHVSPDKGAENTSSCKRGIDPKGILAYPSPILIVFRYFL
jgi:hypothetical protein